MQETRITVVGNLGADPVYRRTASGGMVTNFRIGSTPRVRDREDGTWGDGPTSWWSVSCFGPLADNTARSLRKGERVIVSGSAAVENWTTEDNGVTRTGTSARILADGVGHDLSWGVSSFVRQGRSGVLPLPERPEGSGADPLPPLTDAQRDVIAAEHGGTVDEHGVLTDLPAHDGAHDGDLDGDLDGDEEDEGEGVGAELSALRV